MTRVSRKRSGATPEWRRTGVGSECLNAGGTQDCSIRDAVIPRQDGLGNDGRRTRTGENPATWRLPCHILYHAVRPSARQIRSKFEPNNPGIEVTKRDDSRLGENGRRYGVRISERTPKAQRPVRQSHGRARTVACPRHVGHLSGEGRGRPRADRPVMHPRTRATVADKRALKALGEASAIAAELVVVPDRDATEITQRTSLIMIGVGAGPDTDAEHQFSEDILGCTQGHRPRHAKVCRKFAATSPAGGFTNRGFRR